MRISDWSSDVCSSDLLALQRGYIGIVVINRYRALENVVKIILCDAPDRILLALAGSCVGHEHARRQPDEVGRSEEHTSELQSLMRISYAVFCLKKKNTHSRKTPPLNNLTE